ncbi:MAG: hypothetical protein P1Q69_11535 [Candidatus Thorarchaeota archaeon]|nr:hypothetical protein [Candidatus Thorarchaeota archaeon]
MTQKYPLADEPYSWTESKGAIRIYWNDTLATILRKDRASEFLSMISEVDAKEAQLIMAKITGNFKRGNERNPTRKQRN